MGGLRRVCAATSVTPQPNRISNVIAGQSNLTAERAEVFAEDAEVDFSAFLCECLCLLCGFNSFRKLSFTHRQRPFDHFAFNLRIVFVGQNERPAHRNRQIGGLNFSLAQPKKVAFVGLSGNEI